MTTLIEFHLLQSFVPSNLNRDDNNYPKSCEFGGVRRARISSQCIKRAIRHSTPFKETIPVRIADRTRRMMELFKPRLMNAGKLEAEAETIVKAFTTVYAGLDDKNNEYSSVLVYLSAEDIALMERIMLEQSGEILKVIEEAKGKFSKDTLKRAPALKKVIAEIEKQTRERTSAPDIALYGRMLADNPELGLDAACQVAHAISTHAVEETEFDYFTAVDDLQPKEDTGAGMLNVTAFNSACYYRYACIDWEQLKRNLRKQGLVEVDIDLARHTVEAFMRGLVEAVPTGMKNRFAPNNQPSFALAVVRNGGPAWSLANAFERAVPKATEDGLIVPSVHKLDRYWGGLLRAYGEDTLQRVTFFALEPELGSGLEYLTDRPANEAASLKDWRKAVLDALQE
jgi:CRISPR system Cascade subunit CasC